MTQSPPSPVPSARLRARLAAVGVAFSIAMVAAFAGPAAASTTPSPTPTPTPAAPGEAVFTLAPISSGIYTPGQALAVSATLQNGTDAVFDGGSVALLLGADPFSSRKALATWLAGDTTGVVTEQVATTTIDAIEPGGERTESIILDADSPSLQSLAPGVHPLVATLTSDGETKISTSAVVVPAATTTAVGIGVVVPITAEATDAGLLTSDQLSELTGPAGSLTNLLDAVTGTDAILAVDPAIPAAIGVLGTSAPPAATAWLERLDALPNTRFALQFGDADVVAQVQADIRSPLQPTSLQSYMKPADFAPADQSSGATPSPSPTGDPTAPVYPDLTSLLDIGGGRAGVFWPATGTADGGVVEALGDQTVDGQRGLVLVDSGDTVAGASGDTVQARNNADGAGILVYDSAVSSELHDASLQDESVIRAAHLTAATAYLAFAVAETKGAPLLVTVDRGSERSRVGLRTAIMAALTAPGTTPATIGGIANSPAGDTQIGDAAPDAARTSAASALASDEQAIGRFATVLTDPTVLTGPQRAEVLQLLGLGWLGQPDVWSTALAAHRTQTTTTLGSVGVVPPTPIQLISSGAGIPIWIRNDLAYPANVVVLASPDDLRLEVQERTTVVAQPHSNTRVEIPVRAQIGNGDVSIALQLVSPAGVTIGDPQTLEVHVRADWEGIGLLVIGVLAAGFVALGVFRTIARRRAVSSSGDAIENRTDAGAGTAPGTAPETETAPGTDAAPEDPR